DTASGEQAERGGGGWPEIGRRAELLDEPREHRAGRRQQRGGRGARAREQLPQADDERDRDEPHEHVGERHGPAGHVVPATISCAGAAPPPKPPPPPPKAKSSG